MKRYIYSVAILLFAVCSTVTAQDVHFSQFYATPLHINPAQTGFFNGNFRFAGVYKNQWQSVTAPYSTFSGSADLSFAKNKKRNDIFGAGLLATTDKAGDANYTTTQFGVAFAYNKKISPTGNQYIGVGSSLNYYNTFFDYSNLHFDNEYFGKTGSNKIVPTKSYTDFSVGMEYNYIYDESANFNMGAALFHINQPNISFSGNKYDALLYSKLVVNAGAGIKINRTFQLFPRMFYAKQSSHEELNAGTFVRIRLDKTLIPKYSLYLGSWYRWNDAFVFVSRFDVDRLSFAFSYDFNLSTLNRASNGFGGPEVALLYTGAISSFGKKSVYCPRF